MHSGCGTCPDTMWPTMAMGLALKKIHKTEADPHSLCPGICSLTHRSSQFYYHKQMKTQQLFWYWYANQSENCLGEFDRLYSTTLAVVISCSLHRKRAELWQATLNFLCGGTKTTTTKNEFVINLAGSRRCTLKRAIRGENLEKSSRSGHIELDDNEDDKSVWLKSNQEHKTDLRLSSEQLMCLSPLEHITHTQTHCCSDHKTACDVNWQPGDFTAAVMEMQSSD